MTTRQWKTIILIVLLTIILVLSPFLPGPSFFSKTTNIIFSFAQIGSFLGLLLVPIGLVWTVIQSTTKEGKKIVPILLWAVPVLVFGLSFRGSELARNFSRTIAINNAGQLLNAIENYRRTKNKYPDEISELQPYFIKKIPEPGIMGISRYNYEKKDTSYNLTFTQNVMIGFNFEVVVYDPVKRHKAEGELTTLYDTDKDKWKYYIYD